MVDFYPKYKRISFIVVVMLFVGLVVLPQVVREDHDWLFASPGTTFLVLFLGLLVLTVVIAALTMQNYKHLLAVLMEQCDPERYLAEYAPRYEKACRSMEKSLLSSSATDASWPAYGLNYAVGLSAAGDTQGAIRMTFEVLTWMSQHRGTPKRFEAVSALAYGNLAGYYLATGDCVNGRQYLQVAKEWLEKNKKRASFAEHASLILYNEYYLLFLQGEVAQAQYFFETSLFCAQTRKTEMSQRMALAKIYAAQDETEKQREQLEIVARQGGTLAIAKDARRTLGLPEEAPAAPDATAAAGEQ